MSDYEIAIIGGGPAGLSAALVLARACRKIAVIDAGKPRNDASPGVHAFLSRDGTLPADLKKMSRKQIGGYPDVTFVNQFVRQVRPENSHGGFSVVLNNGETLRAAAVIFAVGMIDELPQISGFEEHWGRTIIHCPFCHGYENRGKRWSLLVRNLDDIEKAEGYSFWTDSLTVIAGQQMHIPGELMQRLASQNITVQRGSVRRLISSDHGKLRAVELDDESHILCDTIIYRPQQRHTLIVADSGVALSEGGRIWIDENFETSISGIFAAGDITPGCQDALAAAAEGAKAAKSALTALRRQHAYPTVDENRILRQA